jgi:hypothetical protein
MDQRCEPENPSSDGGRRRVRSSVASPCSALAYSGATDAEHPWKRRCLACVKSRSRHEHPDDALRDGRVFNAR